MRCEKTLWLEKVEVWNQDEMEGEGRGEKLGRKVDQCFYLSLQLSM